MEALILLKEDGRLESIPPIVMSGPTTDNRDPKLFDRFLQNASKSGVSQCLRHVGLIPYSDVLSLNAAACAVLNPSLFEGWSSSVEEAKSLSSNLIISDIPVHREQAPGASFFAPDNAPALASLLGEYVHLGPSKNSFDGDLIERNAARQAEFAAAFLRCVLISSNLLNYS